MKAEDSEKRKVKFTTSIREDLVEWMDKEIKKLRFTSRSHAIEYALAKLKEAHDGK